MTNIKLINLRTVCQKAYDGNKQIHIMTENLADFRFIICIYLTHQL